MEVGEWAVGKGAVQVEQPKAGFADVERQTKSLLAAPRSGRAVEKPSSHSRHGRICSLFSSMSVRLTAATQASRLSSSRRNSAPRSDFNSFWAMATKRCRALVRHVSLEKALNARWQRSTQESCGQS